MNKILFLIILLCSVSLNIIAHEVEENNLELLEGQKCITPKINQKAFHYFNFGSSIYFQTIGFGGRIWDCSNKNAHDFSLNARFLFFSISNDYILPNFKYRYYRRSRKINKEYFGIGLEVGAFFQWKKGYQKIYPNIELIWGVERSKAHFTQFSINLLPLAYSVIGIGHGIVHGTSGCKGFPTLIGILAIPAIFEYTVGF